MIETRWLPHSEPKVLTNRALYAYIYINVYAYIEDILCFSKWYRPSKHEEQKTQTNSDSHSEYIDFKETIKQIKPDSQDWLNDCMQIKIFRNDLSHSEKFSRIAEPYQLVKDKGTKYEKIFEMHSQLLNIMNIYNYITEQIFKADNFSSYQEIVDPGIRFSKKHLRNKIFNDSTVKDRSTLIEHVKRIVNDNDRYVNELLQGIKA